MSGPGLSAQVIMALFLFFNCNIQEKKMIENKRNGKHFNIKLSWFLK